MMSESHRLVAGRYRLTSQIGTGGMGRVWLARDEILHRDVAVKEVVLPHDLSEAERADLCQRTLREARAAARLSHPNVIAIYDVVDAEDRPWIVMELVRSRTLYQVIKEDGPVTPRQAAEIGLAVLAALRAAHRAGVWHRDVKPGNVLLADDGRVVLTDFGLATYDGDGMATRSGLILGSAQYIAPERARDGVSGPESDMWSLGATLFAAVEGRSPYARDSSMATLTALATLPPDAPRRAGPLRPVLIGLLRKNPRHRMGAAEVEKLLRRIADGEVKGLAAGRTLAARRRRPPSATRFGEEPGELAPGSATAAALADVADPVDGRLDPAGGGAVHVDGRPPHPRTVTEETMRHQPGRHRTWPWVLAGVLLALVVPTGVVLLESRDAGPGPSAAPSQSPSVAAGLTPAMGVQACVEQIPQAGVSVPDGGQARPGEYQLISGWHYYRDPSGFRIGVPAGWEFSRIDSLYCFRDPNSAKAIAVQVNGVVDGHPMDLLARGEAEWIDAAGLANYKRVRISDLHFDEGAADLEYTYTRDGLDLHGIARMMRWEGQVYTLHWLTIEAYWLSDRYLMDVVHTSFGLDP